ncbi:MAG: flagellar FliL protein [bacterium]|jgi:flagellar FliL protein
MANVSKMDFSSGDGKVAEKEESGGEGGGKKKLIIIIVGVLLLLLVGAALYLFVFKQPEDKKDGKDGKGKQTQTAKTKKIGGADQKAKDEKSLYENPIFSDPLEFTVNLKDGKRYLRIKFVLGMVHEAAKKYLSEREAIVRNEVISTLQQKTTDDLRGSAGGQRLVADLRIKLNKLFNESIIESLDGDRAPIKKVLLQEYILQ